MKSYTRIKKSNGRRLGSKILKVLANKYVVKTSENYKGLTYSDIIIRWQRWLLGNSPDKSQSGDILFLRGSVGLHKFDSKYFKSRIETHQGIAILVPIVTTHYNLGEYYNGHLINNEFSLRQAVREHVDAAGPFWATLEINDNHEVVFRLVPNLESFRVESMPFELSVSKVNPFLDKMDEPNYPGKYTALVSGYFVILRNLPSSVYTIRFGGYGMNGFYTESIYKINIKPKKMPVKDSSDLNVAPHLLQKKKNNAINIATKQPK